MRLDFDFELDREQSLALGALALLVAFWGVAAASSLGSWSAAADEAAQRRAILAQVEAAQRRGGAANGKAAIAPAAAFLAAPTQGQASALLQAHLTKLVGAQHASVTTSAAQPTTRDDTPDVVRLRATFDIGLAALQALLYELETGAPYVFVDGLSVSPQRGGQSGAEQPLLRVTLDLRALWRRAQI
jgi:hypothetical protein